MSEVKLSTKEQIEQRTYELYSERGGEDGHDLEDWLAAEKELAQSPEQSVSAAPETRTAAAGLQATSAKAGRATGENPIEIASNNRRRLTVSPRVSVLSGALFFFMLTGPPFSALPDLAADGVQAPARPSLNRWPATN